ncbi:MAG: acyl-CoA thioesterase [Oleispira sp.]
MTQATDVLYKKVIEVRWADCDANKHMRHSAYSDMCAHTRISFLRSIGMDDAWSKQSDLSPVMFKEQTEYFAEMFMGEEVTITVELGAATGSEKSVCWVNNLYKQDGSLAAKHQVVVGWMNMTQRRIAQLPLLATDNYLKNLFVEPA